jgi:hypothetical protein
MITTDDFIDLINELQTLISKKNTDYGSTKDFLANFRRAEKLGFKASDAISIRISDKFSRLCTLLQNDAEVEDETIRDTLLDMAGYCLIMILAMEDEHGRTDKKSAS